MFPYFAVTQRVGSSKGGKTHKRSTFWEFETQEKMERFCKNTTQFVVAFGKKEGY